MVIPGVVKKGQNFTIRYITDQGSPITLCKLKNKGVAFSTLRSPSGTGKSTMLQRFVDFLKDRASGTTDDLSFLISNKTDNLPSLSIGKIPQNPSFVKHWQITRLVPQDSWAATAAFGLNQWQDIFSRRMGELSGGQQRRIYASSVLEKLSITNSDHFILVMDETLDGLGQEGAGHYISVIADAWMAKVKKPLYILLVTHLAEINTNVPEAIKATLNIVRETQSGLTIRVSAT